MEQNKYVLNLFSNLDELQLVDLKRKTLQA
jgi:hypothetical protein